MAGKQSNPSKPPTESPSTTITLKRGTLERICQHGKMREVYDEVINRALDALDRKEGMNTKRKVEAD